MNVYKLSLKNIANITFSVIQKMENLVSLEIPLGCLRGLRYNVADGTKYPWDLIITWEWDKIPLRYSSITLGIYVCIIRGTFVQTVAFFMFF